MSEHLSDSEARSGASSRRSWRTFAPLLLVAIPVVFNLVSLRAEASYASPPNDTAVHEEMVRWADGQIAEGRVPLDGWFPGLALGSPHFHHYQSASHILTGYIARVFGVESATVGVLFLLLALWPISVYWGTRLMGWGRWPAACAALVSPLVVSNPGHGFEHGSYIWSGWGLWSQLPAMWLMPIAWGLCFRAVERGRSLALASLALAATATFHFLTGYQSFLALGAMMLVARRGFLKRFRRVVVVAVGAVLMATWVLVPLIVDAPWANRSVFNKGTYFEDSFGAKKILGWLFTGELFDHGRPAVLTAFVLAGFVICVVRARHDFRARALLAVSMLSLFVFFGRPTLGPLLKLLPASEDLILHRFISAVELSGIMFAGVAIAALARQAIGWARSLDRLPKFAPIVAVVLAVGGLAYPAYANRWKEDGDSRSFIRAQQRFDVSEGADANALIQMAAAGRDGRIYAGMRSNWGAGFKVGYVALSTYMADLGVDAVGFTLRTASLTTDVEGYFDENNRADYDLFNIRYLLYPAGRKPAVPATVIARRGKFVLWRVPTTGYMRVVDTVGPPLVADKGSTAAKLAPFLESQDLLAGRFPVVAFNGRDAALPTLPPSSAQPKGPAGSVGGDLSFPEDGFFSTTVTANRSAVALLKASFDGRWHATVDGVDVAVQMIAPTFVGVPVPPGVHKVVFEYRPFGGYPFLFAIGILTFLGMVFVPRTWAKRRGGLEPAPSPSIDPPVPSAQRAEVT